MDEELLSRAKEAEERLLEAEQDVVVARVEFHRAVRRLHLSGASLRELADALQFSHQRVHQGPAALVAGEAATACLGS